MQTRLTRLTDRIRQSAFALPLAVALATAMLLLNEFTYRNTDDQLKTLVTMGKARIQTLEVLRRLSEAESAQRGYLYTGRSDYLEPFQGAEAALLQALAQGQEHLVALGQPEDLALQKTVETVARNKLSELHEVLRIQASEPDRARELVLSGIGRDQTNTIQEAASHIIALQNQRIATGLDTAFKTLWLNRLGITGMTLASLLGLGLFIRQGRLTDQLRAEQAAALRAERDGLEREVSHRTAELTELARHLETAREDERARLARDLHDELGALLTAAKLDVARIRPSLQKEAPDLLPRLKHLTETLNSGIALKRRIIEDLRPSTLDNLGLQAALEVLTSEFGQASGLNVTLDLQPATLSSSAELTVFRMVQEGLNNITKYAQARQVRVSLHAQAEHAVIQVEDDGLGFDTLRTRHAAHGLMGIRYRVAAEGGTLSIHSEPDGGTRLRALLPLTTH